MSHVNSQQVLINMVAVYQWLVPITLVTLSRANPTSFGVHIQRYEAVDVDFVGWASSNLGLCSGDCDSDSECADDLVCVLRDGNEDLPAGCNGNPDDHLDVDFCAYSSTYIGMLHCTIPPLSALCVHFRFLTLGR